MYLICFDVHSHHFYVPVQRLLLLLLQGVLPSAGHTSRGHTQMFFPSFPPVAVFVCIAPQRVDSATPQVVGCHPVLPTRFSHFCFYAQFIIYCFRFSLFSYNFAAVVTNSDPAGITYKNPLSPRHYRSCLAFYREEISSALSSLSSTRVELLYLL